MLFQSVLDAFPIVTKPLEGCILWPYLDVFGLATTGYGCLCDSAVEMAKIEWIGDPSEAQVATEFAKIKKYPKALHWKLYESATTLRMTQASADALLDARANVFAAYMEQHYFADWQNWPADAQMAWMLTSWACGPGSPGIFKTCANLCLKRNWQDARQWARIKVGTPGQSDYNPGVVPRNAQIMLCLQNAADIDNQDDMATPALYWPGNVLPDSAPIGTTASAVLSSFDADKLGLTGRTHQPAAA